MTPIIQKRRYENSVAVSFFLKKAASRTIKKKRANKEKIKGADTGKRRAVVRPREKHTTMGIRGRFIAGVTQLSSLANPVSLPQV